MISRREQEAQEALDKIRKEEAMGAAGKSIAERIDASFMASAQERMERDNKLASSVADPWLNRSAGMRCSTCMWFVVKPFNGLRSDDGRGGALGRCRRHAPTISGYPATFTSDWCGDHKLDETKL